MAAQILAVQYDVDSSSGSIGVKMFQISPSSSSSSSHVEKILQLPLTKEKTKTMSKSEMKQYKSEMTAYTNLEKKMKQRFADMRGATPDNVIINLANGIFESSIKAGAQGFLKRDYPDIAEISPDDPRVGLTGANFVPMEWLSKHPGLVDPLKGDQKYQDAVSSNVLTQGQKKKREEELRGYKGEGPEKAFYDEVKKYAAQTGHELLLLHGVKFAKPGQGDQESDFVLVDRTLGAVVVTEVKASLNKTPDKDHPNGTLHNAINQVDKIKVILEDWFGDLLKSFKFVGMVFGEVLEPCVTISPTCSPFVMAGAGEILPKLINLKDELKKAGHTPVTNAMDYRELAKYLLFAVHSNKAGAPVVSSMTREVEQRVVEAGSPHNIHYWSCWTPQQLGLMKSKGLRYVLLPSSMATGKTMCLIGKAIEKAEEGEKVLFVVVGRESSKKSLLYFKLKSTFQSYENIKIHYLNINICNLLNAFIQKYPGHSVFIDELVLPEPKYLSEVAKDVDKLRMELDKDTGPFRCLWITVAGGRDFTDADFTDARLASVFKQFFIVKMKIPLRGTKYVSTAAGNNKICDVDLFKSRLDVEIPSNLVEGIAPAIFTFNKYTEAEVAEAVRQAMDLVNREEGTRGVALLVDSGYVGGTYFSWVAQGVVAAGRATPLQYTRGSSDLITDGVGTYSCSVARGVKVSRCQGVKASRGSSSTEEEVELWLEGGNTRPDLITDVGLSRGWEEAVVVTVNSGQSTRVGIVSPTGTGPFSTLYGPENMFLRCICRLITVRKEESDTGSDDDEDEVDGIYSCEDGV